MLVTREGTIYVATPWGLGKSTDAAKTFHYRRGVDWAAKTKQRTGGQSADFKDAPEAALLAEDYVTCLAEDAMGLVVDRLSDGRLRSGGRAESDGSASGGAWARAGKAGGVCDVHPAAVRRRAAGGDVWQWTAAIGEVFHRRRGIPSRAGGWHRGSGASFAGESAGRGAGGQDAGATGGGCTGHGEGGDGGVSGDDWTTQGDGIGRYGRQIYSLPGYGPGGWSQQYKCNVLVGSHQNKNKGGPYTYYHALDLQSERVLYIPNSGKRNQGEWNDGSFDRDAYADTWEGPDLWVDLTLPAGMHRVSFYFINYDAHSVNNRRRDFLVEIKAHAPTLAEADFAQALAKARVVQFYHGVYKQFVVAGPAQYYVKIGRSYSVATKVSGIFLDRLEGTVPLNEPSGVPIMGDSQVKPPDFAIGEGDNVAVRAAAEITAMLDKSWSSAEALALQRPYRMQALRLAAEQGGSAGAAGELAIRDSADDCGGSSGVRADRGGGARADAGRSSEPDRDAASRAWRRRGRNIRSRSPRAMRPIRRR